MPRNRRWLVALFNEDQRLLGGSNNAVHICGDPKVAFDNKKGYLLKSPHLVLATHIRVSNIRDYKDTPLYSHKIEDHERKG